MTERTTNSRPRSRLDRAAAAARAVVTTLERVAVVVGGPSPEADSSRRSGDAVHQALAEVVPCLRVFEYDLPLAEKLMKFRPDVVFPLTHGGPGEGGALQGLLDCLQIPYVGSGVRASACSLHKPTAKAILSAGGIDVPRGVVFPGMARPAMPNLAEAKAIHHDLGPEVVVKPVAGGSSLGVYVCSGLPEFLQVLREALPRWGALLVEQRLVGRELTVAVLEIEGEPWPLPLVETSLPFGSRPPLPQVASVGDRALLLPEGLSADHVEAVNGAAVRTFQLLGCRGWGRVDVFLSASGKVTVLEANTIPGVTSSSPFAVAAERGRLSLYEVALVLLHVASMASLR